MEIKRYVTFSKADIVEALQDLYLKQTGNQIDIRFDESNEKSLKRIEGITFNITLEGQATIEKPQVGLKENFEDEEAPEMSMKPMQSFSSYPGHKLSQP